MFVQPGLCQTRSEIPKTDFLIMWLVYIYIYIYIYFKGHCREFIGPSTGAFLSLVIFIYNFNVVLCTYDQ